MQISVKINRARVSGTVRLSQAARELREAGRDIIDLGEGEPDFDTPDHIIAAAFDAARGGQTRYTNVAGTTQLRQAIARHFAQRSGLRVTPEDVIVGTGAKQLIFNSMVATLNPGDEVIIPAPHWVSYPEMVAIADGTPVIVPCTSKNGFKLTPQDLVDHITAKTRWLILNSPGNPTGAVYSSSELMALAVILRANENVAVLSDDIYQEIIFNNINFATIAAVAPDLAARCLTVTGVSKSYAMTGWRIGFATGPRDLIAAMTKLQGQSTTNASSVSQAAALAALEGPQQFLAEWIKAYRRRRDLVSTALEEAGLDFTQPEGAFYHFVGCKRLIGKITPDGNNIETDSDLSLYLLTSAGVALVPGSEFGAPGYLRICFAKSDADLVTACERIRAALTELA